MASITTILERMKGKRVLVVGDVMLDEFVYGLANRKSPESDAQILLEDDRNCMPGGAANVAVNVASLGGQCRLIGLCGIDTAADALIQEISSWSSIVPELVQTPAWKTTIKTRFIDHTSNLHLLRHDREQQGELPPEVVADLERMVFSALSQVDVLVLSDYLKGVLQPTLMRNVIREAALRRIPVVVDPKGEDFSRYSGATVVTPNLDELGVAVGRVLPQLDHEVESAARDFAELYHFRALCVTRGHCGAQLVDATGTLAKHLPSTEDVVDVAGAGDTFVAALAVAMAGGADVADATHIANASAGIVVGKKAVATASHAEVVACLTQQRSHKKVFLGRDRLTEQVLEWKSDGLTVGFTNGCFDLLHAGHVMGLTEARGQVDRLVVAINSDDSVKRLKGSLRPIQSEHSRMTVAAALGAVDAVIIFHEDTPLAIIDRLKPDIIFKGGDYKPEDVVGHDVVKACGGKVVITAFQPGISTTEIINRAQTTRLEPQEQPSTPHGKPLQRKLPPAPPTTNDLDKTSASFVASKQLSDTINGVYSWLKDSVWPFWLEHGLARDQHGVAYGFHEHLHHNHPHCTADFKRLSRLLVIARQTYVFCEAMAADLESAEEAVVLGLTLMRTLARHPITGLYRSHVDVRRSTLEQRDETYELYDHAFVLFAFASAMKVLPCEETRRDAVAVHRTISDHFTHPRAGFNESLSPRRVEGRRQNPHMHLFEAYLAATEAFGPSVFLQRVHDLARFFLEHLLDSKQGCVPEHLDESLQARSEDGCFATEPGHLAEWVRLLLWYRNTMNELGQNTVVDVLPAVRSLTQFYERHGGDNTTRALVDEVWSDGSPKTSTQRLWPQTERLQAEMLRGDTTDEAVVAAFTTLQSYVDAAPNGLWAERRLSDGSFSREPSPATSLYHLTNAITKAYRIVSVVPSNRATDDTCREPECNPFETNINFSAPQSPVNSYASAIALKSPSSQETPPSSCSWSGSPGSPSADRAKKSKLRSPTRRRLTVVTGGAGFIGSNVVAALNESGNDNIVVCDTLGANDKWLNLRKRTVQDIVPPKDLMSWLGSRGDVDTIIHMGAESSTQVTDGDHVVESNLRASIDLLDWCTEHQVNFIYASSAATYGDGSQGFSDDISLTYLKTLQPLNLYGWSKHLFDKVVATRHGNGSKLPPLCIGLKFFNVFGPNEYHKSDMASLVTKNFDRVKAGESVSLFRSYKSGYADGGQLRDFVYVHDVTKAVLWLLENAPEGAALYNIGSDRARSFSDLVHASFDALSLTRQVDFVDMPDRMRSKYQYFTQAAGGRLRDLGYVEPFMDIEEAVTHYVRNYLDTEDRYR